MTEEVTDYAIHAGFPIKWLLMGDLAALEGYLVNRLYDPESGLTAKQKQDVIAKRVLVRAEMDRRSRLFRDA